MTAQPTGTVTFLFSDIEGSTRRWQDEPEAMRALLVEHDAILRDVIDKHRGHVFKHTGDGVAAVFPSASDAVDAAVDAQGRIVVSGSTNAPDWPTTSDAVQSSPSGAGDGFVAVLDRTLSRLLYSTLIGGSRGDGLRSIAVGRDGRLLAGGTSQSPNIAVADAPQPSRAGPDDGLWVLIPVP